MGHTKLPRKWPHTRPEFPDVSIAHISNDKPLVLWQEGAPHCLTHGPGCARLPSRPRGAFPVVLWHKVSCLSALTQVWKRKAGRCSGATRVRLGSGVGPACSRVVLISTLEVRKYTSRSTQRRPHLWRARAPVVPEVLPSSPECLASGGTCGSACRRKPVAASALAEGEA